MKLLKNRIVIGVLCIVAGLLFSFVALPALQNGDQEALVSVIRTKAPVEAGALITADMLETVDVPEDLAASVITDASSAVGQYANTDIYTGDFLTSEKLSATLSAQDPFSAGSEKGKMVVSITLPSLASGVSGRLLPGDIVTVMAFPQNDQPKSVKPEAEEESEKSSGAVVYPELQYIEVCMISANDGADAIVDRNTGEEEENNLPVTVSFYATKVQALKLTELEQQGIIHLAFVARGKAASRYILDTQRVFNTEEN